MKQIFIGGRLANDPELKKISRDNKEFQLVTFSIASKDRGKKDTTSFFDCIAFGKRAELVHKFCKKGAEVFVIGEPRNTVNKTDDKTYKNFEVIVDQFHLTAGSKSDKSTTFTDSNNSDAEYY